MGAMTPILNLNPLSERLINDYCNLECHKRHYIYLHNEHISVIAIYNVVENNRFILNIFLCGVTLIYDNCNQPRLG